MVETSYNAIFFVLVNEKCREIVLILVLVNDKCGYNGLMETLHVKFRFSHS